MGVGTVVLTGAAGRVVLLRVAVRVVPADLVVIDSQGPGERSVVLDVRGREAPSTGGR